MFFSSSSSSGAKKPGLAFTLKSSFGAVSASASASPAASPAGALSAAFADDMPPEAYFSGRRRVVTSRPGDVAIVPHEALFVADAPRVTVPAARTAVASRRLTRDDGALSIVRAASANADDAAVDAAVGGDDDDDDGSVDDDDADDDDDDPMEMEEDSDGADSDNAPDEDFVDSDSDDDPMDEDVESSSSSSSSGGSDNEEGDDDDDDNDNGAARVAAPVAAIDADAALKRAMSRYGIVAAPAPKPVSEPLRTTVSPVPARSPALALAPAPAPAPAPPTIRSVLLRRGLDALVRDVPDATRALLDATAGVTEAELGSVVADAFAVRAVRAVRQHFVEPSGATHVQHAKGRQLAAHYDTLWSLTAAASAALFPLIATNQ